MTNINKTNMAATDVNTVNSTSMTSFDNITSLKRTPPIRMSEDVEITGDLIGGLINRHKKNVERYKILQDYYEGYAAINNRNDKSDVQANNKLVHPYPAYITDMLQGYFVGKPVSYAASQDDEELIEKIQDIFDYNDEEDENSEIAKMCSIKGRGYEIVYADEEARVRFNELPPEEVIYIWDDKINPEPLFAIWYRYGTNVDDPLSEEVPIIADVYTRAEIITFKKDKTDFKKIGEVKPHSFGRVPVIEFLNNNEGIGDFERVVSLIDAYNLAQSDTANDFEEFTDALLVLYGMLNTDNDDIKQIFEDRVISLSEVNGEQGAEWLIKEINDAAVENYKNRINSDIHKFAPVIDMSDENFVGNSSGVAMKYKLFAMDQTIAAKERKFKRALQERLEIILNFLRVQGEDDFDYREITIKFTPNKPLDEKELVDMVMNLYGTELVSNESLRAKLSPHIIENSTEEAQRIEEEKDGLNSMDDALKLLNGAAEEDDTDEETI